MKWAENLIAPFGLKGGGLSRRFGQISGSGTINLAFLSSDILKVCRKRRGIKARLRARKIFSFSLHWSWGKPFKLRHYSKRSLWEFIQFLVSEQLHKTF